METVKILKYFTAELSRVWTWARRIHSDKKPQAPAFWQPEILSPPRDGGSPPCLWRRHLAFCPCEKPNFRSSFLLSGLGCFLVAAFVLNPANRITGGQGEQKRFDPLEPRPSFKEESTDAEDEDGSVPISSDATHSPKNPTWCLIHSAEHTKFHGKMSSDSKDWICWNCNSWNTLSKTSHQGFKEFESFWNLSPRTALTRKGHHGQFNQVSVFHAWIWPVEAWDATGTPNVFGCLAWGPTWDGSSDSFGFAGRFCTQHPSELDSGCLSLERWSFTSLNEFIYEGAALF